MPQCALICAHQRRQTIPCLGRRGQKVGLLVGNHLHPMFNLPMTSIVVIEPLGMVLGHPAGLRQPAEPLAHAPHPQSGIAPAGDELAGLGEKFDLADATAAKFHVVPV